MKKFSFPTENSQFRFEPKNPYDLVAERRGTRREALTFPDWCRILKIVRTHFVPVKPWTRKPPAKIRKGGGAEPIKTAKEPDEKHRREPYFWEKKIFS